MSDIEAARAARKAGFRDDALRTIVAIGLAECSAYGPEDDASEATNDTRNYEWDETIQRYVNSSGDRLPEGVEPEYSLGQWQINLLVHPEITEEIARDSEAAANVAYLLFRERGNNFSAWSTFNEGVYTEYLSRADMAIAETESEVPEASLYTIVEGDTLSEIAERFNTTVETLAAANNIADPNMILAGATLYIPAPDYTPAGLAPVEEIPAEEPAPDTGLTPDAPPSDAPVAVREGVGETPQEAINPPSEWALDLAATAWELPETREYSMYPALKIAFARILDRVNTQSYQYGGAEDMPRE